MEIDPSLIPREGVAVILFYAPWCGHCQRFKPEFEEVSRILESNGSTARAYAVNVDLFKTPLALTGGEPITGVPTVVILENGMTQKYQGPMTADHIVRKVISATSSTHLVVSERRDSEKKKMLKGGGCGLSGGALSGGSLEGGMRGHGRSRAESVSRAKKGKKEASPRRKEEHSPKRALPHKLKKWHEAIMMTLKPYRIPHKGTEDYTRVHRKYEELLRA